MRLNTLLAVTAASFSTMVAAQTERELGSHEHGSAQMNIALDQNDLFIELETPWNNIIGFEHAPQTDEQHRQVDNALVLLNRPSDLFAFDGTECEVSEVALENSMAEGEHDDHDDDDHDDEHAKHDDDDHHDDEHAKHDDDDDHDDEHAKHDDDDHHDDEHAKHDDDDHHDDEHAKHDDDDHHDDHADHDGEEETHSSVLATYSFNCNDMGDLAVIDVELMKIWTGFEDLDVQLIGPGGQTSVELSQKQTEVDVSQVQ